METWRIIATGLLGIAGLVLVLVVMGKARDRTGRGAPVAVSGAVTFTLIVVLGVLTLTVLPAALTWTITVAVGTVVSVLLLAS